MTTEDMPKKEGRALLESEEWKDGPGQKTICEYHKEGLPDGVCEQREVDDLEYFSDYWKKGGQGRLHSEYHKEGAPYLEEASDWEGHGPIGNRVPGERRRTEDETAPADTRNPAPGTRNPLPGGAKAQGGEGAAGHMVAVPKIERVVDLSTFEVASYAIFRSLFGRGLKIPIRSEGIIDMDLVVKDKDIILNTNQLMFEVPELAIWRLIFAYQGRPVLELGRGVKNRIKIYRWRLAMIILRMWWHGRRKRPAAE